MFVFEEEEEGSRERKLMISGQATHRYCGTGRNISIGVAPVPKSRFACVKCCVNDLTS